MKLNTQLISVIIFFASINVMAQVTIEDGLSQKIKVAEIRARAEGKTIDQATEAYGILREKCQNGLKSNSNFSKFKIDVLETKYKNDGMSAKDPGVTDVNALCILFN